MITVWEGEGVLNPGESNELAIPTGVFALQDSSGAAPRQLQAPPPFMLNLQTPRPDGVPANAEQLFSAQEIDESEPGLFVFARDGHLSLLAGDRTLDIGRGETGFLNADATRLLRSIVTPSFLEFDFIPRPDRFNPSTARLLSLAGDFKRVCR